MKAAFMTANYVAKELDYTGTSVSEWMRFHDATVQAFQGPQFEHKFEELIRGIKGLGFDAIELWVAHLEPHSATPQMLQQAVRILRDYQVEVVAYTAGFGQPGMTREQALRIFETAQAIGASVLANAFHPDNGPLLKEFVEKYQIRMAHENHPEKSPAEVMAKVNPYEPWVGAALDTGWFATQGYDAVQAVHELKDVLIHVHLKDMKAAGEHHSCALGDGIVDIKGVLSALQRIGYTGALTIEHEPFDHDPTEEVATSLSRLRQWLTELA
ncbi:sugar phosphate isomerase/epimerase [Paenibacillus rhizosphaerae]|uniref:Sugar phosphate isomerase/epimerase n=1 Tax=Paenibacillus rhizosphaerae TaxID=297318 RepID=A0A839TPD3_9BACL|nr:sugar phosphate isomerase/epimerase [Paenibacillus rhizosphaerae]MBB3128824.1 sugar phosphate isomerase/epimerase [Paenibacillus rhizosphaerae]